MSLHKEISFETEICQHLASNGWIYSEGDAAHYDRARALFPADVLAWVQATQPKAWDILIKNHGTKAEETLLSRLRDRNRLVPPLFFGNDGTPFYKNQALGAESAKIAGGGSQRLRVISLTVTV